MYNLTSLKSGVRVATDRMADVETVTISLWVDAGARYETKHENGISHLLEHMAFQGTNRRTAREIAEEFDAIGGQSNAYTGREHTVYYAKVLKNDIAKGLDIICDIVKNSKIDEDELAKEAKVVLQEIAQAHDTPDDIIFDYHQEAAFPNQSLGRPVLGTNESVSALTRGNILNYITKHYTNERIVVAAAGNIDHDVFVKLAENYFPEESKKGRPEKEKGEYKGGLFLKEQKLNQLHVIFGFKAVSYLDSKYYTLQLFSTLIGAGMSSRLYQEIREKRGLAYNIQPFTSSFSDTGLFSIYAGTAPEKGAELQFVICDELKKAREDITEIELARAKVQMKASILMEQESTTARAEELGKNLTSYNRLIAPKEIIERIDGINIQEIKEMAASLIAGKNPCIAAMGKTSSLPEYEEIVARLR